MKAILIFFTSIVTLGVIGGAGYLAYQQGFATGEAEGYETGYNIGQSIGFEAGNEQGYDEGYTVGEDAGYETGYDTGVETGYETGYSDGEDIGYTEGLIEGETIGLETGYESGYLEGVDDGIGHGYTLTDPTYSEVLSFIRTDTTDQNTWVDNGDGTGYVCSHFCRDVGRNAETAGFRCALVEIRYREGAHAIVAFDTIDRGIVYIEPQDDVFVELSLGERYYQCIVPPPGTYYSEPDYDDTIMDILLHW